MIDLKGKPTVVGIDPGLSGAVARLEGGVLIILEKFKVLRDINEACKKLVPGAQKVIIEQVHSMPTDGIASAWAFAKSTGTAFGSVYSLHAPDPVEVSPQRWQMFFKKLLGIDPKTYFGSITCEVASKMFPAQKSLFYGPRGGKRDGAADAALLATWGALA